MVGSHDALLWQALPVGSEAVIGRARAAGAHRHGPGRLDRLVPPRSRPQGWGVGVPWMAWPWWTPSWTGLARPDRDASFNIGSVLGRRRRASRV